MTQSSSRLEENKAAFLPCAWRRNPRNPTMAKNRNKRSKNNASVSMEISIDITAANPPQAMDTSEAAGSNPALGVVNRKIKKGVTTRRSKNLRKQKAIEKAIALSEKTEEKISKNKSKISRIQSAKSLYD